MRSYMELRLFNRGFFRLSDGSDFPCPPALPRSEVFPCASRRNVPSENHTAPAMGVCLSTAGAFSYFRASSGPLPARKSTRPRAIPFRTGPLMIPGKEKDAP